MTPWPSRLAFSARLATKDVDALFQPAPLIRRFQSDGGIRRTGHDALRAIAEEMEPRFDP